MERPHAVSVRAPARTTTRVQPGLGVVARFRSARLASPRLAYHQRSTVAHPLLGSARLAYHHSGGQRGGFGLDIRRF
jgi:hypothetical protein